MTTATKIPDNPLLTFDFGELTPTHTWDSAATDHVMQWSGQWIDTVDVTLVGHADGSAEPAKSINWWWWNNQQAIKDAGMTNADTFKVSSWAMVVDINFVATSRPFHSAVQQGHSVAKGDATGATTIAFGDGCGSTAVSAGDYCLTEDANTNALKGVCDTWIISCAASAGCDPDHATAPVACTDNSASPVAALDYAEDANGVGNYADWCYELTAFTQPAVGAIGDNVGVAIWNTATKAIPGIRIGRKVKSVTNCDQTD